MTDFSTYVQIVNLNAGNLESLRQALKRLGIVYREVRKTEELNCYMPVVLPGVGAFGAVAKRLWQSGIGNWLQEAHSRCQPILGICLGMQLLGRGSDEDGADLGLDIIPGEVHKLPAAPPTFRVPNIGWCFVSSTSDCLDNYTAVLNNKTFYHIHSYFFEAECKKNVWATISFCNRDIPVAIARGATLGVQFHPEKSQEAGLDLLALWRDKHVISIG